MDARVTTQCTAFEGARRIASGDLAEVAIEAKQALDRGRKDPVLIFDDATGEQIEVDFRGTPEDIRARFAGAIPAVEESLPGPPKGPGRPKLGVVAREITLLPRHWDWLNGQPGGASVALRKLVEEARRANEGRDRDRRALEAAYRFMSALAGNLPAFEEATRALFARRFADLEGLIADWPGDIREHVLEMIRRCEPAEGAGVPAPG